MNKKFAAILPAAVFAAFILTLCAANLLTPDRARSEYENRSLAQKPEFSLKGLFSGRFTAGYEEYLTDQFAGRDGWVALRARAELAAGKTDVNGVYIGSGGFLCEKFAAPDPARVSINTAAVKSFAASAGVPVHFTLIPGSCEIWSGRLPANAQNADQAALISEISAGLDFYFDSYSALAARAEEYIYCLTDHHWTSLGAYYGYASAASAMGLSPQPLPEEFDALGGFFGTASAACGIEKKPDSVGLRVKSDVVTSVRLYSDGEWSDGEFYDLAARGRKDKYTVFLGGNHPLAVIKTAAASEEKLLLIKDSFANAELPYLCAHFSEIHVVDLRYYKASMGDYIAQNGITRVLVSYSVANFVTDTNIPALKN